ncbi:MAG: hypothetical protein IPK52_21375 [Chloroflexi bacterium]|nr:hypothetical protein [Chloroflexota bacterium]
MSSARYFCQPLAILLSVLQVPLQAQAILVVAEDGLYTTIEAALAVANAGDIIEVHGAFIRHHWSWTRPSRSLGSMIRSSMVTAWAAWY